MRIDIQQEEVQMDAFEPKKPEEFGFQEIIYEKRDWVARVTINRPHNYNAYSTPCLKELITAFQDAAWDDSVAVLVLTGAGEKAFCTGGDVKEYAAEYTKRPRHYWKYMGLFRAYIEGLMNLGKPTIARINGIAVGGGNETQMACDLAVMADHAYIRQVGSSVGSVACGGATQFLPIYVGDRRAREILWLNEKISAQKALDWGLVNMVVPSEKLDEAVDELCQKLVKKFPECMRYTKQQTNFWRELAWHSTIGHARDWLSIHYASWEPNEGMSAFVEKREADYMKLRERARDGGSSEFMWGPYSRQCGACGARGIPEEFSYCGKCGEKL